MFIALSFQQNPSDILQSASETIKNGSKLGFSFEATDAKGKKVYEESGNIQISGNKYYMDISDELIIKCDGTSKWIYNMQTDEVIISNASYDSSDIAENPFILFGISAKSKFQIDNTIKQISINNEKVNEITLIPKDKKTYKAIYIAFKKIGSKKYYPVQIKVVSANNTVYKANVNSFEETKIESNLFTFNTSKYPNAIITDLR
jgi:Outer membrane lipoprotein carrier protein LolA.